jgi:hypothetical protein
LESGSLRFVNVRKIGIDLGGGHGSNCRRTSSRGQ